MVLLERRWFWPDTSLPQAAPEDEVWQLESTGEVFTEYTDYLNQLYLTRTRVWSSVYSGVGNLTYEEALREDERGHALAKKVRCLGALPAAGAGISTNAADWASVGDGLRSSRQSWRARRCDWCITARCVWTTSSTTYTTL
jgi:hypothetical protein